MMDRRTFLTAASLATLGACATAGAQGPFDLVIKGGRVIDPASRLDGARDVAVTGGRIVAVRAGIEPGAAQVHDARSKLIVPGLIDIHTHVTSAPNGSAIALADGVTRWVDCGTRGADNVSRAIDAAKVAKQPGRILINIGRSGVIGGGDTIDLNLADVGAARAAIKANPDWVVGIKCRLSSELAGPNDLEDVRRAQEVTRPLGLPVMIHIGHSVTPLGKLVDLLKPGDVVTHLFTAPPHGLLDDNGRIIPEVRAARTRGVFFDVGNGRGAHVKWDVADRILQQGFLPDTISSDWTLQGYQAGTVNLPNIMSSMLMLGFTLEQVVACTTTHAARIFADFRSAGTLQPGAPADIAILDLREGAFDFADVDQAKRTGKQKLFNTATVLGGRLSTPEAKPA